MRLLPTYMYDTLIKWMKVCTVLNVLSKGRGQRNTLKKYHHPMFNDNLNKIWQRYIGWFFPTLEGLYIFSSYILESQIPNLSN